MSAASLRSEILRLAWPVFIGQLAVIANGTIDTVMAGRLSADDLAAVGLGSSIYVTLYVSLMGVLLALTPIAAQHVGAGRLTQVGASFWQSIWVALALSVPGCLALGWTQPWIALSQAPASIAPKVEDYLAFTAAGVPAALVFRSFYAVNTAIGRPQVVMLINLAGVLAKIPLNLLLMHGSESLRIPALGGAGCGLASSLIAWLSAAAAMLWLWTDGAYRRYLLHRPVAPRAAPIGELLRLGVPIGATYFVEVTSFTFMAILVARFGSIAIASHQVPVSLTGAAYMVALAIASATSSLVARAIGAQDEPRARALTLCGLRLAIGMALLLGLALLLLREPLASLYTRDAAVAQAAAPLLAVLAVFVVFDSLQTQIGFVLRAYKISTLPMLVCVVSMWGIGLGGGWLLTIGADPESALGQLHGSRHGALGFWVAGALSLVLASAGLALVLRRLWRR